ECGRGVWRGGGAWRPARRWAFATWRGARQRTGVRRRAQRRGALHDVGRKGVSGLGRAVVAGRRTRSRSLAQERRTTCQRLGREGRRFRFRRWFRGGVIESAAAARRTPGREAAAGVGARPNASPLMDTGRIGSRKT